MENIKMKLETDYEKYGNDSGMEIDTLSVAIYGSTYNDLTIDSLDHIDQYIEYALNEYDYEAEFLDTLSKQQAAIYIDNQESYKVALAGFTDDLREEANQGALDESHPLAVDLEEARSREEEQLYREWLYGDYREPGLLRGASRRYGVDFTYNEKEGTLTFDIEQGELEDLLEYQEVENTPEAVGAHIASLIENDAYTQHQKTLARRKENQEAYQTRKRIQAEREAEAEAARIAKLKAIS